ncbi:MAG: T9SS type A sorting domain-containing protein [Candidatus Zixiibacteriota bacterium]
MTFRVTQKLAVKTNVVPVAALPPHDNPLLDMSSLFSAKGRYRTLSDLEISQMTEDPAIDYEFDQNYPNPFNPTTTFRFGLPQTAHVTLEVYNILGQKVTTLADREYPPGRYTVDWDSRSADGQEIASGVYFARFKAGEFEATQKMVVVK